MFFIVDFQGASLHSFYNKQGDIIYRSFLFGLAVFTQISFIVG